MKDIKVKVGLTGVVHPNMPGDDEGIYAGIAQAMEALKRAQNFDLAVLPQPLRSEADGFENMYIDERELEKKLGTYRQTRHTVEDIVSRARGYDDAVVRRIERIRRLEGAHGSGPDRLQALPAGSPEWI